MGDKESGEELSRRYLLIVRRSVSSTVYAHRICPEFHDTQSFIDEVVSRVMAKFVTSLSSFRFEQPFEHWVKVVCGNEAYGYQRELIGRGPVKRHLVGLATLAEQAVPSGENVIIIKEVLRKHAEESDRNKRCVEAIRLRFYEGLTNENIAQQHQMNPDYLSREFTRNFREMQRLLRHTRGGGL